MGNIGFTGKTISKKLDKKTIQNGGLKIINMPIANCKVASELELVTVEVGGYKSYIHYNKSREEEHRKDKENKRKRSLKRQVKQSAGRSRFEDLPSFEMTFSTHAGESK